MRWPYFMPALAAALICLAVAAPSAPALAQNEALQFLLEQSRQRQVRPVQRKPVPRLRAAPRIIEMPRRAVPQSSIVVVRDAPGKIKVDPAIFVTVFGDAMGELLGGGLEEALTDAPDVAVTRRSRAESGLVRTDFYDWQKSLQEYFTAAPKINFAVMQLGVNDRQPIRDDSGQNHEPGSEQWRAIYAQRVDMVARIFAERQVPLVWVGLPPMPSASHASAVKDINEIVRQKVTASGGQFIDIWDSFSGNDGQYAASGPDVNGQNARLRAADGVHFSKSGARKAAHFAEVELKRLFGARASAPVIAIPAEPSAPDKPPAPPDPLAVERIIDAMVAGQAQAALPLLIPIKPVAGPIVPLNRNTLTGDATLISRASQKAPLMLQDNVLAHGRPQQPLPGRVDDFSWPPR